MRRIQLTRGQLALVDEADFLNLSRHKWFCSVSNGGKMYACRRELGTRVFIRMHRQIMRAPIGVQVDHKDGDGLNNRRLNLRLCLNGENPRNIGIPKHNASGYLGVSWKADRGKWQASIKANGKSKHLGYFLDPVEAATAYDGAAIKLHGDFATVNF